jgi:hypothetical protein
MRKAAMHSVRHLLGILAPLLLVAPAVSGTVAAPVDPVTLSRTVAAAKAQVESALTAATAAHQSAQASSASRKSLRTAFDGGRRDLEKHLAAGAQADKKRQAAAASTHPDTAAAALDTARTEYDAVTAAGPALQQTLTKLAATEAELNRTATTAASAGADAKTGADRVKTATSDVDKLAAAARTTATRAQSDLSKAKSSSGFLSATAYATAKGKIDADLQKLATDLAPVTAGLAEVNAALKQSGAKVTPPAPPPKCSLRSVDWKNMSYPWLDSADGRFKLTKGSAPCQAKDRGNCPGIDPSLAEVYYGDLAGDGKEEAVIEIFVGSGDAPLYEVLFLREDASCHLELLGRFTNNAQGAIVGHAYVAGLYYDRPGHEIGVYGPVGSQRTEYRLVGSKIQEAKGPRRDFPAP